MPSRGSYCTHDLYDFAVVDFPDPSNYSIGKLYTTAFYGALARHLPPDGRFVAEHVAALRRKSFWCVVQTVEATRLKASPYHVYVPAFGEWGFVIAAGRHAVGPRLFLRISASSRSTLPELFTFPPDMQRTG
jgi:spermidine synthase